MGALFPLGSTAFPRSLLGHIAWEVEWRGVPRCHRAKNPVGQKQSNTNERVSAITNNYRGTSGITMWESAITVADLRVGAERAMNRESRTTLG